MVVVVVDCAIAAAGSNAIIASVTKTVLRFIRILSFSPRNQDIIDSNCSHENYLSQGKRRMIRPEITQ